MMMTIEAAAAAAAASAVAAAITRQCELKRRGRRR